MIDRPFAAFLSILLAVAASLACRAPAYAMQDATQAQALSLTYRIEGAARVGLAGMPLGADAQRVLGTRRVLRVGFVRDMRPLSGADAATHTITGAAAH